MEFIKSEKRECVKFISWYQKLMYHRYGRDDLYYFLFKIVTFLAVINLFFSLHSLLIIEIILLSIMIFRKYSKNISKRRRENSNYLLWRGKIKERFRKRDKDHIYKRCRGCKTILRLPLPSTRGVKQVRCPSCQKRQKVLCFRKQQIEVIRKGVKINI